MRSIHLIAVQAALRLEDYRDEGSFHEKIAALTKEAVAGLDDSPKLVVFPEYIGLPLLATLGAYTAVKSLKSVQDAIWLHLKRDWKSMLRLALRHRAFGLSAFFIKLAVPAYLAYRDAFRAVAKQYGVTIVAGTSLLPHIEEEAARGIHIAGKKAYNTAFSFGPQGSTIDRTYKCNLVPGLEASVGLSRAMLDHVHGFETPVGKLGVAICLDGFMTSIIDRLDGLGIEIVVQPSANLASWTGPWPPDPRETEGSAWLKYGLRAQLQNRLHLKCGVNPMMVGDFLDLHPRGRSSIVVNTCFYPDMEKEGYPGLLEIAASDNEEEIVRAQVEL